MTLIVHPAQGYCKVRLINTAGYSREDLDLALSIFEKLGR